MTRPLFPKRLGGVKQAESKHIRNVLPIEIYSESPADTTKGLHYGAIIVWPLNSPTFNARTPKNRPKNDKRRRAEQVFNVCGRRRWSFVCEKSDLSASCIGFRDAVRTF